MLRIMRIASAMSQNPYRLLLTPGMARTSNRSVRTIISYLILSLAIVAASPLAGVARSGAPADQMDRYLSIRSEMGNFSGAVLVARYGKVLLRKGYGYADVERKIRFTPETQHEVASVSKMFTAMAVLVLRDRGKLKLDDPICRYVDDCPESWKAITIEQLLHHTSGIPDYEESLELGSQKYLDFMVRPDASATIFANARKLPLDFAPGEKFNYSNTGYIVLGQIVERAAGQPFEDFVVANVLKPAGMTHSGVLGTGVRPHQLANGYTHGDLGWERTLAGVSLTDGHLTRVPRLALTPPEGDAWLYSTVDDLYRWSLVMDGRGFVPATDIAEIFHPGLGNYGLGWFVDTAFDRKRARHTGFLPGYATDFIRFPDDGLTIVIVSNLDRARLNRIAWDISAIALGKPYDMPLRGKVVKLAPDQLARLEGKYRFADGTFVTIANEPDYLTASVEGKYKAGLIPLSATEFFMPLAEGRVTFSADNDGRIVRVNLRYSGEDHIAER